MTLPRRAHAPLSRAAMPVALLTGLALLASCTAAEPTKGTADGTAPAAGAALMVTSASVEAKPTPPR